MGAKASPICKTMPKSIATARRASKSWRRGDFVAVIALIASFPSFKCSLHCALTGNLPNKKLQFVYVYVCVCVFWVLYLEHTSVLGIFQHTVAYYKNPPCKIRRCNGDTKYKKFLRSPVSFRKCVEFKTRTDLRRFCLLTNTPSSR